MIETKLLRTKTEWVEVVDPGGLGKSLIPASRLDYYLSKGFKAHGEDRPAQICAQCGFAARDRRGLGVHLARRHGHSNG